VLNGKITLHRNRPESVCGKSFFLIATTACCSNSFSCRRDSLACALLASRGVFALGRPPKLVGNVVLSRPRLA